ncbi:hypothetical protein [Phaeobacter sp.]|uniref:hypothetical protein n=1 Tax=Phaeobacter sp. TaxID=1902409 RepID=UPI0025EDDFF7|nr:hypothetical protein [Phaeobacter sp.]
MGGVNFGYAGARPEQQSSAQSPVQSSGQSRLMAAAQQLEQMLLAAHRNDRHRLGAEFSHVLARLRIAGVRVPPRMVRLDQMLHEEFADHMFDNMPV